MLVAEKRERPGARGGLQGRRVDRRDRRPLLPRAVRDAGPPRAATSCARPGCASSSRPATTATSPSGSSSAPPRTRAVDTYQLDRGRFENELVRRARSSRASTSSAAAGSRRSSSAPTQHTVTLSRDGDDRRRHGALGRRRHRAREHPASASSAWRRTTGHTSTPPGSGSPAGSTSRTGRARRGVARRGWPSAGFRRLATNHLIGQGYWVWLIPLASGPISIGVCADPRFHPFERDQHARRPARLVRASTSRSSPRRSSRGATTSRTSSGRGLLLRLEQRLLAATAGRWSARRAASSTRSTRPARTSSRYANKFTRT